MHNQNIKQKRWLSGSLLHAAARLISYLRLQLMMNLRHVLSNYNKFSTSRQGQKIADFFHLTYRPACLRPRPAPIDSSVTIIIESLHLSSVSPNAFDVSDTVLRLMHPYLKTTPTPSVRCISDYFAHYASRPVDFFCEPDKHTIIAKGSHCKERKSFAPAYIILCLVHCRQPTCVYYIDVRTEFGCNLRDRL